ncbi:hypothetical protein KKF55_05085 [Patescibacteria group bacterium]|nr:hypothetical protein [Patescibacteria group bacterium]
MTDVLNHDFELDAPEQESGVDSTRRGFLRSSVAAAAAVCLGGVGGCATLGKKEKVAFVSQPRILEPECLEEGKLYRFTYDFDPNTKDKKRSSKFDMRGRRRRIAELNKFIFDEWVPENNFAGKMKISTEPIKQYRDQDEPIVMLLGD